MLNKVILLGNLTADPILRYTPNGVAVCTFTVAVNKRVNGENQADYINIVTWQKLADICANYLRKGSKAAIEGRLQTRNYTDGEGKKRYVTEVVAENVQFLSGKPKDEQEPGQFNDPFAGPPINIPDDFTF